MSIPISIAHGLLGLNNTAKSPSYPPFLSWIVIKVRRSLHLLSVRLVDAPTVVPAPPSAASRIAHKPFASLMHEKWNEQVDSAYNWVRTSDRRLEDWGHRLLYGDERSK